MVGIKARMLGVDKIKKSLERIGPIKSDTDESIYVGFAARHASYVHEINKNYQNGQWKFLEHPYRLLQGYFAQVLTDTFLANRSLSKGLEKCAKKLLKESVPLAPMDTGELRASGVIAWEHELEVKANAAKLKGERKRKSANRRRRRERRKARNARG